MYSLRSFLALISSLIPNVRKRTLYHLMNCFHCSFWSKINIWILFFIASSFRCNFYCNGVDASSVLSFTDADKIYNSYSICSNLEGLVPASHLLAPSTLRSRPFL